MFNHPYVMEKLMELEKPRGINLSSHELPSAASARQRARAHSRACYAEGGRRSRGLGRSERGIAGPRRLSLPGRQALLTARLSIVARNLV